MWNYHFRVTLSVVIITFNEEANLPRTLESVKWADEIVVVDSGSTDRTVEIAKSYGAKVWVEPWKGFAAQKNSALEKAACDWVLSLDADEEVSPQLTMQISMVVDKIPFSEAHADVLVQMDPTEAQRMISNRHDDALDPDEQRLALEDLAADARSASAFWVPRKNIFLGRFIQHGGFYPDEKLRLFRRGSAKFEMRLVHEDIVFAGPAKHLSAPIVHHAYPTLSSYIEHMNRYSSLGAEMAASKGKRGFSLTNIVLRPWLTFVYNYIFRLGFLDGREGFLLHLYHAVYVSWKYAKLWELTRDKKASASSSSQN
ncbi:MAG TPA: glycosyltransferase family 2 protein [Terriglobales bacterium]|nr:glycosyltransferase family 2 protein [Terriglobales bacterium]